jgi:FMN phosphatase YigB (HAD superfamily)
MKPDQRDQRDQRGRVLLALDVDGVLLDAGRDGRGPWQVSFGERFGVDPFRLNDTLFAAPWPDVITGQRPVEAALAEALAALGWDMGVEAALQCWFEEDFVVDPMVLAAATQWSELGVPLALVSNQEPRRARYLEQRLTPLLPPPFGTAFSGDIGAVKGDCGFYSRAERHLGLEPGAPVVFLDDTLANVVVASAHGWKGIHFSPGGQWHDEVAAALDRAGGGLSRAGLG